MNYEEFKSKYGIKLNPQQEKAVQAVEGNVLLLAVPGSGKTTVLVARLGYMLCCCGIRPEKILTMTYTVAATRDMKKRFAGVFGEELAARLEFRTINSVSAEIVNYYSRYFGRKAFRLISDEGELSSIVGGIYRTVSDEYATESDISAVRTLISYTKNMQLTKDEILELNTNITGFGQMFEEYKRILRQRGLMDFDDQMVYAHTILNKYPEISQHYREKYSYICVDEAQDSSKIQHRIIDLLSSGNLFMVGDEDQSIYGFRAAYPEALTGFEETHHDAKILFMEKNYRSSPQIVSAASRFIKINRSRHDKRMEAVRGESAPVREIRVENRRGQYEYLAKVAEDCRRETAVLYRDNDCALPIIDILARRKLPYRCRQMDSGFFTSRVVRDIKDIINFAQDQTDGYIFMRIYYKLGARINKAAAEAALKSCPDSKSLLAYVAESSEVSPWTRSQCRSLIVDMDSMLNENAGDAVYRIVNHMGYGEYLERNSMGWTKTDILQALGEPQPNVNCLLSRLDELEQIVKAGSSDENAKFILSTIHSSKGLEYDRVYMADVIDDLLPCRIKDGEKRREAIMEEERRLFYVGMTRAENELNIFTFRRRDMFSTFAETVFRPKSKKPDFRIKPPSAVKVKTTAADKFVLGSKVEHNFFGEGQITWRDRDLVEIQFDNGERKTVLLPHVLRLELLKLK